MQKPKQLIDAVETASNIHKGDFSSLRGKSFVICDIMEKNKTDTTMNSRVKKKHKYTLAQIGKDLAELRKDVKGINTRLDYIVKTNDLKDISNK